MAKREIYNDAPASTDYLRSGSSVGALLSMHGIIGLPSGTAFDINLMKAAADNSPMRGLLSKLDE